MKSLRISLAQLNCTVGALAENRLRLVAAARRARDAGADWVVFPELALSGYPPEDLVMKPHFLRAVEVELTRLCAELPPEPLCLVGLPLPGRRRPRNAVALIRGGRVEGIYAKRNLPNYGVFDECRVFESGDSPLCVEMNGARIGLHICEDSWLPDNPDLARLSGLGLHALVNLSASPFHRGKLPEREAILGATSLAAGAPLVYCNLVGGQDELVFDGGSLVITPDGAVPVRGARFREDLLFWDLTLPSSPPAPPPPGSEGLLLRLAPSAPSTTRRPSLPAPVTEDLDSLDEVYAALCLGLRDYADKNGFREVLVAISGGIDSALVAAVAVDALGAARVTGISLPTRFSSEGTRNDALRLAESLGIPMPMLSIQHLVDAYGELLAPLWPGRGPDVTEENLQARIRGTLVMALSNKFGRLVVATGNKSEMATGYATLYGDMCGGFALIKDVPKTLVFDLCRRLNERAGRERIPQSLIDRPPSAELRDNQKDSDSLPPYETLDAILSRYIEQDMGRDEIVAEGFDAETVTRVIRLVDGNEYKRRQSPPGVKITPRAFGRDRRMPITNHFRPAAFTPRPETA